MRNWETCCCLFTPQPSRIWSKGEHNTKWCLLTCRCLSVIDKSWDNRYSNVKPGCFFSYQDNCLIGICWLESHENKSEGFWCSRITATHFFFFLLSIFWDATDHSLIPLCCLCKSHVAGLICILLLGSGWTWSSLVVYINSDSEDYRVYAAMLRGSERATVTKPSE